MQERNGVRLGQEARDLDGNRLGRVTRLYEQGFAVTKGFPILFRRDHVMRYEEVRGVRDGALVVARSSRDLFDLAAGELPPSWRIPTPPGFPSAATPDEARGVFQDLASRAIAPEHAPAPTSADLPLVADVDARDENALPRPRLPPREAVATGGMSNRK